jgi:WXG100 family type VII secretion target
MNDKIRLNYPAMQQMAQQCVQVSQRLGETQQLVKQLAQQMQSGAFLGAAGEIFANALSSSLANAVQRLADKFTDINNEIQGAIADMQAQDQAAGGRFQ